MHGLQDSDYETARVSILADIKALHRGLKALRKLAVSGHAEVGAQHGEESSIIASLLADIRYEFTTIDNQQILSEEMLQMPNPSRGSSASLSTSAIENRAPKLVNPPPLSASSERGGKGIFGACFGEIDAPGFGPVI